jgi:hypothetical protein
LIDPFDWPAILYLAMVLILGSLATDLVALATVIYLATVLILGWIVVGRQ